MKYSYAFLSLVLYEIFATYIISWLKYFDISKLFMTDKGSIYMTDNIVMVNAHSIHTFCMAEHSIIHALWPDIPHSNTVQALDTSSVYIEMQSGQFWNQPRVLLSDIPYFSLTYS